MNLDDDIIRLLDGSLDESGRSSLARRLESDPAMLKQLGAHLVTEGLLGVALEDESTSRQRSQTIMEAAITADREEFVSDVRSKIHRRIWRNRLLASAAALLLPLVAWFTFLHVSTPSAATITRAELGGQIEMKPGDSLASGALVDIEGGLLELDMAGRGRMIVEGPAKLQLVNPMHSVLHRGRILMRVTEKGHGYRLETSKGSVIDLGTEFGVSVDENQAVETHVLDGEVDAIPAGGKKVRLIKDDALRFNSLEGERFRADGGAFYTELPPVRKRSIKVVHWPLEVRGGTHDVAESIGLDSTNMDMQLSSMDHGNLPTLTEGRFGKGLSFDGVGSFAESGYPGVGGKEPRTVSFWVKVPSDFNIREGFGLVSWGRFAGNDFGAVWQVSVNPLEKDGPIGRLRVGTHGGQVIGATDLRDGKWHHVAVVLYESSRPDIGKQVLIYLDGKIESISRRALQEVNTRIEDARHGVWLGRNVAYTATDSGHNHGGFFRGCLDEVSIFHSALSQEEVRRLMEQNELPR